MFDYTAIKTKSPVTNTNTNTNTNMHQNKNQSNAMVGNDFWQVKKKTIGVLDSAKITLLTPGKNLPEVLPNMTNNTTTYFYNRDFSSKTYGLLQHVEIEKHAESASHVKGRLLNLALAKAAPTPITKIAINVIQNINSEDGSRTVTMQLIPANTNNSNEYDLQSGFNSGTKIYSLKTGVNTLSYDPMKNITTRWVYDAQQRPIKKIITAKNIKNSHITTWSYIVNSNETSIVKTDFLGNQVKTVLDGNGNIIKVFHRNSTYSKNSMLGEKNWIQDRYNTYTSTGKLSSTTTWHAADSIAGKIGKSIGLTTTYGYDVLNRKTWVKNSAGVIKVTLHDDPAMRIIKYTVVTKNGKEALDPILHVVQANILGKPEAIYEFSLNPNAYKNSGYIYSKTLQTLLKNIRQSIKNISSLHSLDSNGLLPITGVNGIFTFVNKAIAKQSWVTHTITKYDGQGRKIMYISGDGATSYFKWEKGNLVAVISPDGRIVHDSYDLAGNKISRCIQAVGSSICHILGTRQFSVNGNLLWQADEYGNKIKYKYDADNRLIQKTTPGTKSAPKGHTLTWKYNSFGMTKACVDGVIVEQKNYDSKTWQILDTEDRISHLHYVYNSTNGLLTSIIRSKPVKLTSWVKKYKFKYFTGTMSIEYDRYLQPIAITDILGTKYTSIHDKFGRLVQKQVQLANAAKSFALAKYQYDSFGKTVAITNGLGVKRVFEYSLFNQLASTTDFLNGKQLNKLSYSYNADTGNITQFTRKEGGLAATEQYTYDINNNLKSMNCFNTNNPKLASQLCPRDTDIKDGGILKPAIITSQDYSFDNWNNIKQVTEKLFDSEHNKTLTKTVNYTYANANSQSITPEAYDPHRLIAFNTIWANQTKSTKPKLLTYDAMGRIILDADGNKLHYNALGQQDAFTNIITGEKTVYWYNAAGHQVIAQPFNAKGTKLQNPHYRLYHGSNIAAHMQQDSQNNMHTIAMLQNLAKVTDGKVTDWFLHNYKGDVITILNNKGIIKATNLYSPYGMQVNLLSDFKSSVESLHIATQKPWWQMYNPGFDGQMTDLATGYQFLGGGYRAYNPIYKHFMSQDSFSPFKKIDGYGFGDNNPIMNTDPTGHMPKWFGYAMGGVAIAMAGTMALLLPVATAALAPSIVSAGLSESGLW